MPVPGREYDTQPLNRTHSPGRLADPVDYRPCLRLEFRYACVYCLSLEAEIAGGARYGLFEVEHFRPIKWFGSLRTIYSNLMWACYACNRAKRSTWPDTRSIADGWYFVDPTAEPLGNHLRTVDDEVFALTRAGEYMIDEFNLNSEEHRARRRERERLFRVWTSLQTAFASGAVADPVQRAPLEQESQRILNLLLGTLEPWDPEPAGHGCP